MKRTIKNVGKYAIDKYRKNRILHLSKKAIFKENDVPDLSSVQKAEIKDYWGRYGFNVPLLWHRALYCITDNHTPHFLPESTFVQDMLPYLRDPRLVYAWGDKSYLDKFLTDIKTPLCILRNIDGVYADHDFELITAKQAEDILDSFQCALVIKPATDTNTGKGVKLLRPPFALGMLQNKYHKNFVIQLPLKQHDDMGKLNSSSVNTIRVNSLMLDNTPKIMSAFVKVGQAGAFADNHGHDRFFIGISKDGHYLNYAINHDMKKYDSIPSGYDFAGKAVPHFNDVCETVKKAHMRIPHFKVAFWDICIDEEGVPVVVEVNLRHPNALIAQAAIGDAFFGDHTDKVLEYIASIREK